MLIFDFDRTDQSLRDEFGGLLSQLHGLLNVFRAKLYDNRLVIEVDNLAVVLVAILRGKLILNEVWYILVKCCS